MYVYFNFPQRGTDTHREKIKKKKGLSYSENAQKIIILITIFRKKKKKIIKQIKNNNNNNEKNGTRNGVCICV